MEQTLTFNLTRQEADLIVQALGEQPYKISAKLISSLQMQYQQQQKPTSEMPVKNTNEDKTVSTTN